MYTCFEGYLLTFAFILVSIPYYVANIQATVRLEDPVYFNKDAWITLLKQVRLELYTFILGIDLFLCFYNRLVKGSKKRIRTRERIRRSLTSSRFKVLSWKAVKGVSGMTAFGSESMEYITQLDTIQLQ